MGFQIAIHFLLLSSICFAEQGHPPHQLLGCYGSGKLVRLDSPLTFCVNTTKISCCSNGADKMIMEEFLLLVSIQNFTDTNLLKMSLCERCAPIAWADGLINQKMVGKNQDGGSLLVPPPSNFSWTYLVFMGPFALIGIYQGWRKYVASCLGWNQTQPTTPPSPSPPPGGNNTWFCCLFSNIRITRKEDYSSVEMSKV